RPGRRSVCAGAGGVGGPARRGSSGGGGVRAEGGRKPRARAGGGGGMGRGKDGGAWPLPPPAVAPRRRPPPQVGEVKRVCGRAGAIPNASCRSWPRGDSGFAMAPGGLECRVLYRDALMIVIDKPAGM